MQTCLSTFPSPACLCFLSDHPIAVTITFPTGKISPRWLSFPNPLPSRHDSGTWERRETASSLPVGVSGSVKMCQERGVGAGWSISFSHPKKHDFRFQDLVLNVNPCLVDALQSDENWESLPTQASRCKDLNLGIEADISDPGTQLHSLQQLPPSLPSLSFLTFKNANVFSPLDECLAPTENSHH